MLSLSSVKATLAMRAFSAAKIPMLFYVRPTVVALDDKRCEVRINLRRRTKNHLNSMYFGVLATGADAAGGFLAMNAINSRKLPISLIFKDFHAEFLKRPEADVHFVCEQGPEVAALVDKALTTGERQNFPLVIHATCPSISSEVVAKFVLTLSLKKKTK
jgi:acyl-coenzyme A thioesterase PaaI-like protein